MPQINITGKNIVDADVRQRCMTTLNDLSTKKLEFLEKLIKTPNALDKLIEKQSLLMKFL